MQDEENLYILSEPIMGGELFSHLCMNGPFVEADARFYAACAIEALAALHANGCVRGVGSWSLPTPQTPVEVLSVCQWALGCMCMRLLSRSVCLRR